MTGELFCFKVVVYKGLSDKEKEQLVMEVNVMRDLKHPNIVRYVDRVVDRSKHLLYIIMEYCDSGDLAENMRQFHKHYEKVNEQVIFDIALQLLFALSYCHNSSLGKPCLSIASPCIVYLEVSQGNLFIIPIRLMLSGYAICISSIPSRHL